MAQRILAIEMAGDRVRAVAADRAWNTLEFKGSFEKFRTAEETDLAGALSRLAAESGVADVVLSALPAESVVKRLLELPFADSRRLNQVVPFALEEHLPFPVDDGVVSFTRAGVHGDSTLVIAAMARKTDLVAHLKLLAGAGFDPKTVTLAPLAMASMLARARNGATPGSHLIVESDADSTSIVLLDASGAPRAMRTLSGGLVRRDGSATPADEAGPVLATMRQTILAHGGEPEVSDIVLTGAAANAPKLRTMVAEALAVKVRDVGDFHVTSAIGGAPPDPARFGPCVAMLLSEVPAHPLEILNFRSGEFAFRGSVRGDASHLRTPSRLVLAAIAIGIVHFSFGLWSSGRRLSAINARISAIVDPVMPGSDPARARDELQAGLIKMNKRIRLIGGNVAGNSPLDTLLAISRAIPPRFPAEIVDLQVDQAAVHMNGQADSYNTVDQMKRALDQGGYFGDIEVSHAKSGSDSSRVDFKIDAGFRDAGPVSHASSNAIGISE